MLILVNTAHQLNAVRLIREFQRFHSTNNSTVICLKPLKPLEIEMVDEKLVATLILKALGGGRGCFPPPMMFLPDNF